MRIIPKKIKVKNTVWKCYSMPDVIVALVMFAIIFASVTTGNWAIAVILGIVSVVMFMPTQDGIFYACILENVKFLFSKKKYTAAAKSAKESVDALIPLNNEVRNGSQTLQNWFVSYVDSTNTQLAGYKKINK